MPLAYLTASRKQRDLRATQRLFGRPHPTACTRRALTLQPWPSLCYVLVEGARLAGSSAYGGIDTARTARSEIRAFDGREPAGAARPRRGRAWVYLAARVPK